MRKRLLVEAQRAFSSTLLRVLPAFDLFASEAKPPGYLDYVWRVGGLAVFLSFCPSKQNDVFGLEAGWSEKGVFPGGLRQLASRLYRHPRGLWEEDQPFDGGMRFDVSCLLSAPGEDCGLLIWDVITGQRCRVMPAEARPLPDKSSAGECAEDAVELVRDRVLPYIAWRRKAF